MMKQVLYLEFQGDFIKVGWLSNNKIPFKDLRNFMEGGDPKGCLGFGIYYYPGKVEDCMAMWAGGDEDRRLLLGMLDSDLDSSGLSWIRERENVLEEKQRAYHMERLHLDFDRRIREDQLEIELAKIQMQQDLHRAIHKLDKKDP